ncbi:DNA-directed RNA polymerase subunit gamma [Striga asiatica]|uniref:DNA-directed RNA polymerase subunit gamma n=1 Tax=Striga asiatica TaxID=4170 RepID=A0A5A7Q1G9_STRAF|nr:DNA-directed RNA polymerase subunit gamma [Striga asiatica]
MSGPGHRTIGFSDPVDERRVRKYWRHCCLCMRDVLRFGKDCFHEQLSAYPALAENRCLDTGEGDPVIHRIQEQRNLQLIQPHSQEREKGRNKTVVPLTERMLLEDRKQSIKQARLRSELKATLPIGEGSIATRLDRQAAPNLPFWGGESQGRERGIIG